MGKLIEADFKVPVVSTGDMLRQQISDGTEAGKEAEGYIERGELVPDNTMRALLTHQLKSMEVPLFFAFQKKFLVSHKLGLDSGRLSEGQLPGRETRVPAGEHRPEG